MAGTSRCDVRAACSGATPSSGRNRRRPTVDGSTFAQTRAGAKHKIPKTKSKARGCSRHGRQNQIEAAKTNVEGFKKLTLLGLGQRGLERPQVREVLVASGRLFTHDRFLLWRFPFQSRGVAVRIGRVRAQGVTIGWDVYPNRAWRRVNPKHAVVNAVFVFVD